ncbi:MAG: hypothetical protein LAT75_05740 [Candidatus Cyclonatronum sp.]|uniref:hypothetical protein n=1 Tax=Cyclonatronum sp. TaxID=3024185 RepID=UPI0025BBD03F|nr:hypothetical protein [Cyclonatronum sp.]MCH8486347.1 hypothetical protein [Cyclonatronum sp.]
MSDRIIYSIKTEDLQTVAREAIGRALTEAEILKIEDSIAERIPWFEIIEGVIHEKIDV